MGEPERGDAAPRVRVSFWCANRHETRPAFAADAAIPETWDCPRCGNPAGQNEQDPPAPLRAELYRTHLAYLKERRSASDGEAILAEALARLHGDASTAAPAPQPAPSQNGQPLGAARAGGGPDQRAGDAPAAARQSATSSQGLAEPAAPGPAAEGYCDDCGYKRTAPGHKMACLGQ
jgi:hypothetical protein